MRLSNLADFFLTGMVVLWPALLWAGHDEAAVLAFALLLFAIWICGMLDQGDDGRRERDVRAGDRF
jgi:hypothetical protein